MTCAYCGTELPAGAMFCGECGRAVSAKPVARPAAQRVDAPTSVIEDLVQPGVHSAAEQGVVFVEPQPTQPWVPPVEAVEHSVPVAASDGASRFEYEDARAHLEMDVADEPDVSPFALTPTAEAAPVIDLSGERCTQCGTELAPSDIFCGECGFVRKGINAPLPNDTVALDPFPWGLPRSTEPPTHRESAEPQPAVPVELFAEPDFEPVPESVPHLLPENQQTVFEQPVVEPPVIEPVVEEPVVEEPVVEEPVVEQFDPAPDFTPIPSAALDSDFDETRIVGRPTGQRFVLQFSTGQSVSVSGTGLVGRNPVAEPGEYFDTLVTIVDPGKSVSKTHLEFGQQDGVFWVSDRFSGNGTIVREPDGEPRRCDAGKRYQIARGSRVDIAEQFFIVS